MNTDPSRAAHESADMNPDANIPPRNDETPADAQHGTEIPTDASYTFSAPATQPVDPTPPAGDERGRPRTGPIVWGAIVLAFCLYVAAQALAPGSIDGTTFVIASVIGLGLLLLVVGAVVLGRGRRR